SSLFSRGKRAAAFQSSLAPPPSTTGHETGGVGTAVESLPFQTDPPPADDLCWPKTAKERRELIENYRNFKASDLPPPATISVDPGHRGTRDPPPGQS
ncbi:hypothetical protein Prudu_000441, partial [Prunus dulcis]